VVSKWPLASPLDEYLGASVVTCKQAFACEAPYSRPWANFLRNFGPSFDELQCS
jgi:hypothetical protein